MTGRGRGATLPAWMTAGDPKLGIPPINNSLKHHQPNESQNIRTILNQGNQGLALATGRSIGNSIPTSRDRDVKRDSRDREKDIDRDRKKQRHSKSRLSI